MTIEFVDEPVDGREKYGPILADIKLALKTDPTQRDRWAVVTTFEREATARDTASRLTKQYPEFEFRSRKRSGVTSVYALLKEGA